MIISIAVLAASFLYATPAATSEVVPCPEHKIGLAFHFETKNVKGIGAGRLIIIGAKDGLLEIENSSGAKSIRDPMMNTRQKDGRFYLSSPRCPFKLGDVQKNEVAYFHAPTGSDTTSTQVVTVSNEWEDITTPAGTFKAVKVVMQEDFLWAKGNSRGKGSATITTYYAPAVGIRVTYVLHSQAGGSQPVSYEERLIAKNEK